MPCTDSITLKPSGKLSTCTSKEPSVCESSAGPVFSHWGQRRFSTQRSREDIFQVCACGAPVQPQSRCHTQIDPLPAIAALGCAILRTTPGSSVNIANGGGQIFETL